MKSLLYNISVKPILEFIVKNKVKELLPEDRYKELLSEINKKFPNNKYEIVHFKELHCWALEATNNNNLIRLSPDDNYIYFDEFQWHLYQIKDINEFCKFVDGLINDNESQKQEHCLNYWTSGEKRPKLI